MQNRVVQKEVVLLAHWSYLAQVADACELARAEITEAAVKGAVWRKKSGKRIKLDRIRDIEKDANAGDTVFVNYDRSVLDQQPDQPVLVSDQGNYSVWYKPQGMLSQGSKWSDHCTLTTTAATVHGKKCLLVHRLDRAARGLVVIAHTKNACTEMAALFAARKVEKIYNATVHGHVDRTLPWSINTPIDGKDALSVVLEAEYDASANTTQLKIDIKTGRKHQIRSHLSAAGFPVIGDRLFDAAREHTVNLELVASELQFQCPFSKDTRHIVLADSLQ